MLSSFPSATQLMDFCGFYRGLDKAGYANTLVGKNRGGAIHAACHYLALGEEPRLNAEGQTRNPGKTFREVYPDLRRFIDPVEQCFRDHDYRHEDHEVLFVSQLYRLTAHPDWRGTIDGVKATIEIKTGDEPEWVKIQLALQGMAMEDRSRARFCLSLPGNGKYRLRRFTDFGDFREAETHLNHGWGMAKYFGRWWNEPPYPREDGDGLP